MRLLLLALVLVCAHGASYTYKYNTNWLAAGRFYIVDLRLVPAFCIARE